ncbi:MAG: hypothetical protein P8H05_01180 [Schleiferiaceae bacterium]|nr:hypothetical protein [Schleiferiaceae bacterium]
MSNYSKKEKNDSRRGWAATLSVHSLLFVLFTFFGLNYQDPPPEMGIPINFGYDETGFGENFNSTPEAIITNSIPDLTPLESESVVTQDIIESIGLNEVVEKLEQVDQTKETKNIIDEIKPAEPKIEKPEVASELSNRLNSSFGSKSTDEKSNAGEGRSKWTGNEGQQNGNLNTSGKGGSGVLGFSLGSRKSLSKLLVDSDCGVVGDLYLNVWVDNDGLPYRIGNQSIKGTTITDNLDCAIKTARELLKKARWEADYKNTYAQGIKISIRIPFTL